MKLLLLLLLYTQIYSLPQELFVGTGGGGEPPEIRANANVSLVLFS